MTDIKIIVGLGNPGGQYEQTRHNLGFMVVNHLAEKAGVKFSASSFTKAVIAKTKLTDSSAEVWLMMPLTYMNASGIAIKQLVERHNVSLQNILIVCDDLSLPFGQLRIRPEGGAGGHNGLRSIIEQLNSQDFPRLRMGIHHPGNSEDVVDYVLEEFGPDERQALDGFIEDSRQCCLAWTEQGIEKAMEQFNRR